MKRDGILLSVVICTYNRGDRLGILFDALRRLRTDGTFNTELIFIDNNSSDSTKSEILGFVESVAFPVDYIFEKKRGSSAARNAGIRAASGSVIAVLDDDCLPDPDWLINIARYFARPDVDVAGGRVLLHNPLDLPMSIRTSENDVSLERLDQLFGTIPGCNMAFRRNVLESIGLFDEEIGAGLPLAGEDVDLIYRALRKGYKLRYTPTFCVYHNHGRRTPLDASSLNRSYVRGRGGIYAKYILQKDWKMARMAYWEMRTLFRQAARKLIGGQGPAQDLRDLLYLVQGFSVVAWKALRGGRGSVAG